MKNATHYINCVELNTFLSQNVISDRVNVELKCDCVLAIEIILGWRAEIQYYNSYFNHQF